MPDTVTELTLTISGMDCASCARTVETGVARLEGVERCELNFSTERLRVSGAVTREQVVQRVRDLGYDVVDVEPSAAHPAPAPGFFAFLWSRLETRLALAGGVLVLPGIFLHELLGWDALWIDALALMAMALTIVPVARSAWRALTINREVTINALMTIAAVGAVVIGAYVEAGLVMVLFALGEALEGYTSTRARQAIKSLMEVVPQTALRLETSACDAGCCDEGCGDSCDEGCGDSCHGESRSPSSHGRRVPVAALRVGDVIVVRPGERIPMDGTVRSGASAVNQAPITGESRLIEKEPGAEVFAGSINGEGSLEVAVTNLAADTTIARMIRLVEEAQERRAPVQRLVDRFAKYYTPAVVLLALLVASLPPLVLGLPFWNPSPAEFGWLYRGLALLVVACPCALVISTPVTLVSAMSAAARAGVLIKGGAYLEAMSRVRAVALDKTGTLTAGRPDVVAVRAVRCQAPGAGPDACDACSEVLALAGAVESRSEHPLAHAIVAASARSGLGARIPAADGVTAMVGRGVTGRVGGREVLVGSHRHFDAAVAHDPAHCAAAAADAALGRTPVLVSVGGAYLGTITLADTVRASSREAVARLKAMGLAAVMLTGDQQATAERIAGEVGVTAVRAELLPAQKVAAVEALKGEYGAVAMVGDGINDAPALASASVGVAIGGAHGGTNQAMETADVTLMSDDLRRLPFAIGLSRAAMGTVKFNIALSIGIKLVFLALVLLGVGTMWMAVLADVGTSLLVTLNGMRLLGYRPAEGGTGEPGSPA